MSRWVETRIPVELASQAVAALLKRHMPLTFELDLNPPASGPEAALSVQDLPEDEVRVALLASGVPVLAIRMRLGGPSVAAVIAAAASSHTAHDTAHGGSNVH